MSYILDALRRADSERERGSVPGIHAQPVPPTSEGDAPPRAIVPWIGIGAAALLVVAAIVGWMLIGRDDAPREVAQHAPVVAPAPAAPAVTTAPTVAAAPVVAAPVVQAAPAVPTPLPSPAAPVAAAVPAQPLPAQPLPAPPPTVHVVRAPTPHPAAVTPRATEVAASAPVGRVYLQSELPPDVRRDLPQLTIGGSIYSNVPSNRFLIINGQIFHEGDKLAPELWLEQIKLKAAVLKYKGYRYGIDF